MLALFSSGVGAAEFILNPIVGRLSDMLGRKAFLYRTGMTKKLTAVHAPVLGELTAQVRISESSDCTTWYENERVCGMTQSMPQTRSFSYQALRLENSEILT